MPRRQLDSSRTKDCGKCAETVAAMCHGSEEVSGEGCAREHRMISLDGPIRIVDLGFSVPVYNALTRAGIVTLGDLLRMSMETLAEKVGEIHYGDRWQQIRCEVQTVLARLDLLM